MILLVLFASCNKDEVFQNGVRDMYVTVYVIDDYGNKILVPKANVFSLPATDNVETDDEGLAVLSNIPFGNYTVYASYPNYGSGLKKIALKTDSANRVSVQLKRGVFLNFAPEISILSPTIPAMYSYGELVKFAAKITDADSQPENIVVTITSSIDGKLLETKPDENGNVTFQTTTLSRGQHIIYITAIDQTRNSITKTFTLSTNAPKEVVIDTAIVNNGQVTISWQKYSGSDFQNYEIYRTQDTLQYGELISSSSQISTLTYTDKTPPICTSLYYYVKITNADGLYRISKKTQVKNPAGKIFYYSPVSAAIDPANPVVYIVDNASNKIKRINYETNQERSSALIPGTIGVISVGDNGFGLEVYVPSSNGNIYVLDATSLDLKTSILTGISTKCVVNNGNGYLVASLAPSPWWEQPVRTYSRSSGINVSSVSSGLFENSMLKFVPNTNSIISISTSVSPIDMDYLEFNSSGVLVTSKEDTYHGDHDLNPSVFGISANGEYSVTGTSGSVYSIPNMIYKGAIERGALLFSDFVTNADGSIIYAATSNRSSIQIVHYPELSRSGEILTKGAPKFIFYRTNELISITPANSEANIFIIERLKLN